MTDKMVAMDVFYKLGLLSYGDSKLVKNDMEDRPPFFKPSL